MNTGSESSSFSPFNSYIFGVAHTFIPVPERWSQEDDRRQATQCGRVRKGHLYPNAQEDQNLRESLPLPPVYWDFLQALPHLAGAYLKRCIEG